MPPLTKQTKTQNPKSQETKREQKPKTKELLKASCVTLSGCHQWLLYQTNDNPESKIAKKQKGQNWKTQKSDLLIPIPALRNIIDLTLDGHEEGLLGVRAVVGLKFLLSDLADLNGGSQRLHLRLEVAGGVVAVVGGGKEARNDIVDGENKGEEGEEGGRRKAGVGNYGFIQCLP